MEIMHTIKKNAKYIRIFVQLLIAALYVAPLYIAFTVSFKTPSELAFTGLAFPETFRITNYTEAMQASNFVNAFKNSFVASLSAACILMLICSMASYIITRNSRSKFYSGLYYFFVAAMVMPFQVVMLPMYTFLRDNGLMNIYGYILTNVGFQIAYNTFIFCGFIKTVPIDVEEAAYIDGAGLFRTYWRIVFPLLKPIILTAFILNTLSVWNDFALALIILPTSQRTLPFAQYMFISQKSTNIGRAFATFIVSMIPILLLYFFLQKYIISGITSGAVKG